MAEAVVTNSAQPAAKPAAAVADPAKPAGAAAVDPAAKPAADPNAEKFVALTRLQTENLQLKQQIRELPTLRQKIQALEQGGVDVAALKAEAKRNPLAAMKALDLEFKQVAEWVINSKDGAPDPIVTELERLKGRDAERERKDQERETQEKQKALDSQIATAKAELKALIDNGEEYELLKVYKSGGETGADLVFGIMVNYYKRTGNSLDEQEALKAAEAQLVEDALSMASTGKVQSALKAKQEAAIQAAASAEAAAKASGKGKGTAKAPDAKKSATLSNKDTAASAAAHGDEIDRALPGSKNWDKRVARAAERARAAQQ